MTAVRIATEKEARRVGATQPIAPQYTPLGNLSRRAIQSIVRAFGAPVTEAQGNRAAKISGRRARLRADTVEVICQTVG